MVTLTSRDFGSALAICMRGNAEEINARFRSFWNHGATNGELHWIADDRAYFWTSPARFKKAVRKGITYGLFFKDSSFRGKKEQIRRLTQERLSSILSEDFIALKQPDEHEYNLGAPEGLGRDVNIDLDLYGHCVNR